MHRAPGTWLTFPGRASAASGAGSGTSVRCGPSYCPQAGAQGGTEATLESQSHADTFTQQHVSFLHMLRLKRLKACAEAYLWAEALRTASSPSENYLLFLSSVVWSSSWHTASNPLIYRLWEWNQRSDIPARRQICGNLHSLWVWPGLTYFIMRIDRIHNASEMTSCLKRFNLLQKWRSLQASSMKNRTAAYI